MKKKFLFTFTALLCAVVCAVGFAACSEKSAVKLSYELSSDSSYYTVTEISTSEKTDVIVPSEHEGKPVKRITCRANGKIARLSIPDSVNYIGENAFYGCGADLVTFGDYADAELSTHDEKIQLYSLYIGDRAFVQCNLTKVTIPDDAYLGTSVFQSNNIAEVKFGGNISVKTDGSYELNAFRYCPLTSIVLPEATVSYSVSLSCLANTSPSSFDEKTYTLPLKYVVAPACVKLSGSWARGQINNYNVYPPEIYCKATELEAAGTPFYSSIDDIRASKCYQFNKPEKPFYQFVYYYSESKPTAGSCWRFVNGVPAKW